MGEGEERINNDTLSMLYFPLVLQTRLVLVIVDCCVKRLDHSTTTCTEEMIKGHAVGFARVSVTQRGRPARHS